MYSPPFLSECPEEVYDPRSLYERLQEQKDRKQQEHEEQFRFSELQGPAPSGSPGPFWCTLPCAALSTRPWNCLDYLVSRCSFGGKETAFYLLDHIEHFRLELSIPILILCSHLVMGEML